MVDIFTPEQWQALTGPFSMWEITTRRNVLRALPLGEVTAPGPLATPFTLSDEQIQLFVDACEPDAVLADLDMDTRSIKPQDIAPKHETAVMCVNVWRQYSEANPKRSDRRVLRMFAQKALDESPADWLHSQDAFKALDEISQGLPWS